jgi:hypothetical protein
MTRLPLKESLFLGFCAVFILLFRVVLRLHLHIPGHAMLVTVFFLFLARGCVGYRGASTCTGLLAGLGAFALGLGKIGPMLVPAFVLPGMVIDLGALLLPGLFSSSVLCVLVAGIASATKFIISLAQDLLLGMDTKVMVQHAAFEAGTAMLFGIVAGLLVVPTVRRLKAYGLVGQGMRKIPEDFQQNEGKKE